jgi:DNA processing protein
MDQEKVCQLALFNTPLVGGFAFRQLIRFCGSAQDVYACSKKDLLRIPGIGEGIVNRLSAGFDTEKAEKDLRTAEKHGVQVIFYTDNHYPHRLKHINDAPAVLFYKGNANLNHHRIISIVGTRRATVYGKKAVHNIVEGLVGQDVIILSGLAYGIDIEAHKKCLELGIPTIGAMASGPNKVYPFVHRKYANQMLEMGGLITEYGFDVDPEPAQFPARNRIIAGLSDATIVVEAAAKGGALITADFAAGYDREVFAVPGPIKQETSEGCNNLIKKHKAHLLTSAKDIIEIMNWDLQDKIEAQNKRAAVELDPLEKQVFEVFQIAQPFLVDEVSAKTALDSSTLSNILLNLEFKGLIHSLPGKQYIRA